MLLGFKAPPGETPYWFGKHEGVDRKLVRVMAGVVLPQLERQMGALVVIGELFRSFGPVDLSGLAARVGAWSDIENALGQFRKDLKFDHVITENDESRELLWRIPGLSWGVGEIPCLTYAAPKWASTEVARQKVDALVSEGRLHIDNFKSVLDREPEQGAKAIQFAVTWALENKAYYQPTRKPPRGTGWLGTEGL